MTSARHTPPGDESFRVSVLRSVGGAVALVVIVAAVFWAIGSIGGPGDAPLVVDPPADGEVDGEDAGEQPDDGGEDATGDDGEVDDGAADDDADDGDADDGAPDDGEVDDGADDGDAPDEPAATIDRATISVQVLDGYKVDNGAAAGAVAAELDALGYRIVARNPALDYAVTTVLYNPGFEEAAAQLAADIGGAEVRAQPGNLSTQVDLHVVVGADRA